MRVIGCFVAGVAICASALSFRVLAQLAPDR